MKAAFTLLLSLLVTSVVHAQGQSGSTPPLQLVRQGKTLISDRFTDPERPSRRLTRGDWKVADGAAICTQDDELFRKYKNHGPAVWYDQEFKDGVVRFEFRPSQECKQFVFTVNGKEGHVFRFVMNETGTNVRAWNANHQPRQLVNNGPPLTKGEWIPVTVELAGAKACVQIGERFQAIVEDPSYAADKIVVGVSFHYGTVELRNFDLAEAVSK